MSAVLQIISHEYRRYIFTRGFLLFLLFIPLAMVFGASTAFLQEATEKSKEFVVIDQEGGWISVIDAALKKDQQEAALARWDEYVTGLETGGLISLDDLEPPFRPETIDDERLAAFEAAGGIKAASKALSQLTDLGLPPLDAPKAEFIRIERPSSVDPAADVDTLNEVLAPYIRGDKTAGSGRLFGALIIPSDFSASGGRGAVLFTDNMADRGLRNFLGGTLGSTLRERAYLDAGLNTGDIVRIGNLRARIDTVKPGTDTEDNTQRLRDAVEFGVPLGLTYILFFAVISVGGMMLTNTIEEKSNKIVEMLLSSVSAGQLMFGKMIGLALVGVTPMLLFSTLGFMALTAFGAGDELFGAVRTVLLSSPLVPLFFLYFLLGYLLYASIYLAIGALCSSIQDAQSLSTPLTIIMLLPTPFLMTIVEDPNGLFARIFTWIPFYTHYALMLRLSGSPPLWEVIGATLMLAGVVAVMFVTMGRIYRAGILQGGGNANWKTFLAAARAPKDVAAR